MSNLNIEICNVWYRKNSFELTSELILVYVRNRSVGKPPVSGILLRGPLQETRQATAAFACFYTLSYFVNPIQVLVPIHLVVDPDPEKVATRLSSIKTLLFQWRGLPHLGKVIFI
jgi:hypothetical protein